MTLEDRIQQALESIGSSMQSALQSRLQEVRAELSRALEEDRMAAEADANSKLAAEIAAARSEADKRVADETARLGEEIRQSAAADADRLRHQLDELRGDADRARQENEQAALEIAGAQARAAAAEQALEEANTSHEEAFAARASERQDMMQCIDRLITAVRRVDSASTLSDVLNALADGAAAETSRTAVLIGAGDAYQIYKLNGFEGVQPAAVARKDAENLSRGLPFAPLPGDRAGFAFPITVGGKPVALVYGDDASREERTVPSPWPEVLEVLGRAAAARLETLTAARTVQALGGARPSTIVATTGAAPASTTGDDQSARRYARLLVSEIKLYNETAVRTGREHRDLLDRLRPEIERARRLYEERVPTHVAGRMTYFDDELVHTLADGDPSLLGARR